ncbi:hypothetical protein M514_10351 [Trichuris suis]|uniref:RNA polymerase I-specific transcription initiation factor RRN3 n=1 Tax=Trichuris suis TaxID=68888 RepID=A0A085NIQ1_9BILA|nr:hypothetical protein M514_10351 [Trichuris suis]
MTMVALSDVSLSIKKFHEGDTAMYYSLCAMLTHSSLSENEMLVLLDGLEQCVDILNSNCTSLLTKVKSLDWRLFSDEVAKAHVRFLLALVASNLVHLDSVILVFVKKFLPDNVPLTTTVEQYDLQHGSTQDRIYTRAHIALQELHEFSPMVSNRLLKALSANYPFFRRHTVQIRDYNRNLLRVSEYLPYMKSELLSLVIEELSKLDTLYGRESYKELRNGKAGVFDLETDDLDSIRSKVTEAEEFAQKLDCCLSDLFVYLQNKCCDSAGNICHYEADATYNLFCSIFQQIVLPIRGCSCVPFIWLYLCSLNNGYAHKFLELLWLCVTDPNIILPFRSNASCYLASLAARAKVFSSDDVISWISVWVKWLHRYLENQDDIKHQHRQQHSLFYEMCQAVFYVVVFRCKEIAATKNGFRALRALQLNRLVTCTLNPLKFCDERVATNFANVARNYKIAFCHEVIERNRRASAGISKVMQRSEGFFPFDAYPLEESAHFISGLYNEYDDGNESEDSSTADVSDKEETTEEEEQLSSSLKKNSFSYHGSPGFMQRSPRK